MVLALVIGVVAGASSGNGSARVGKVAATSSYLRRISALLLVWQERAVA